ncbi:hypothetical protein L484_022293 [Morus notabilis]|uniref:CLAVATA3/ESR (CLE)-related protein 13 n=1 Tax=Morus notabilis TaxID=981085 RepID=W9SUW2_9ROSA|nr:hypothetical protein L484_022293 [Morus notabilis]
MAVKLSYIFSLILWLSFFFLFFHVGYWFSFNHNNSSENTVLITSDLPRYKLYSLTNNRKLASKINFTPFLRHRHHHHRHHHHRHKHAQPDPGGGGSEIDPRYGVEKRLVPTGPNPLHH